MLWLNLRFDGSPNDNSFNVMEEEMKVLRAILRAILAAAVVCGILFIGSVIVNFCNNHIMLLFDIVAVMGIGTLIAAFFILCMGVYSLIGRYI